MQNKNIKLNKGLYLIDIDKYKEKTTSQLWEKDNRNKFFGWIFSLLVAIAIMTLVYLSEIIFWIIDKSKIINWIIEINKLDSQKSNATWVGEMLNMIINLVFSIVLCVSLIISIQKCKINKSFAYISYLPTLFIFFQTIYAFFSLFRYLMYDISLIDSFSISWIFILQFVLIFIYPLTWFFVSRNVSLIRRIAIQVDLREKILQYNQENQSNFGAATRENNNQSSNTFNTNDAFYLRLKNLTRDQLNDLAKSLSISGYESLNDEELIKIIYDIRSVQNKDAVDKEIQTDNEQENKN